MKVVILAEGFGTRISKGFICVQGRLLRSCFGAALEAMRIRYLDDIGIIVSSIVRKNLNSKWIKKLKLSLQEG